LSPVFCYLGSQHPSPKLAEKLSLFFYVIGPAKLPLPALTTLAAQAQQRIFHPTIPTIPIHHLFSPKIKRNSPETPAIMARSFFVGGNLKMLVTTQAVSLA
jgi:hypothetical protein